MDCKETALAQSKPLARELLCDAQLTELGDRIPGGDEETNQDPDTEIPPITILLCSDVRKILITTHYSTLIPL